MDSKSIKLNKEQKQAVDFGEGPLLIIAGAGTGKTTVITRRIARLIEQKKAKPEEILALTFTDKAAGEMEKRVDRLLPCGYADLWISTFHSFCERILRDRGLDIGLPADFKLLNETDTWLFLRRNLNKFKLDYYKPLGSPAKFIRALISHFSRCKDQGISPDDYLKYARKIKGEDAKRVKEIALAYKDYQNLLLRNGLMDFGDLINYCLELFKKRPSILERYRKQFRYILVDEFQDTNWAQYELIKLLAAPKNNLTVCADDDQAIYRFRGASFGNVVQFHNDFPKAKQTVLLNNYRSSQNILDLSYKFIQLNNPNRLENLNGIGKKLKAAKKEKGIIENTRFKTAEMETRGVANKIIEILKKDKEADFNDFAVLARTNKIANDFSLALGRTGIPYRFMALKGLYSKPVILDIVCYFKLLDNYHESSALYRVLNLPVLNIPAEDIAKITQYSRKKYKSVYECLKEIYLISGISKQTKNKADFILKLIKKHSELASSKNASEVFVAFMEDSGYLKYLIGKENAEKLNLINQFYNKVKAFEESNHDPNLRNFMEELNLELESGEQGKLEFDPEQGSDMAKVMTVHAAKGLEFKYVFLVGLADRRFPSAERKEPIEIPKGLIKEIMPEGDVHLEEERRLFYVGMTRAKKGVFFSSAADCGGKRKKKISRFLIELGYGDEPAKEKIETVKIEKKKKKKEKFALPSHFSFTQLRAFGSCPLQYKFAHIYKIPIRGKAVFSFGRTIHRTLFEFVKLSVKKQVKWKDLIGFYEKEWTGEWYEDRTQRDKYYELGKKCLKNFYSDFKKTKPPILKINGAPALEQSFRLKIGGYAIIGKIDRIDEKEGKAEIIDYKTGKAKERLKPEEKQQLIIYQMAAEEIFGLKLEKLTFHYLENGKKVSFLGSEKTKKEEKEKIISQIKEIKRNKFSPAPGWQCQWCDFKEICQYARKN